MKHFFPSNSLKTFLINYVFVLLYQTIIAHSQNYLAQKAPFFMATLQNHFLLWAGLNRDADVARDSAGMVFVFN